MTQTLGHITADFETQLAVKMAVGATTGTLQSATDDDGIALPTGRYFLTIDRDNSYKEYVSCTLTGTALTNVKTLSRQGTETAGTVREHRVGANVIISDFGHIKKINDLLDGTTSFDSATPLGYDGAPSITTGNQFATKTYSDTGDALSVHLAGTETITGTKTFTSTARPKYDTHPTFSANEELIDKKYADDLAIAGSPNASTTVKGIVEEATGAEITAGTATGATGARLYINPNTIIDTSTGKISSTYAQMPIIESWKNETISPSRGTPMVQNSYSNSSTSLVRTTTSSTNLYYHDTAVTGGYQSRAFTSDWAAADSISSTVQIGAYLYVLLLDNSTAYRVYRYDKTNLAAGGTLMTFSGQSLAYNNDQQVMSSDGTSFYFNNKAGNSANTYVISKYSLSGTTLTYVSDITCGSTANDGYRIVNVVAGGDIYLCENTGVVKRFNSSGTLQTTYGTVGANSMTWHSQNGTAIYLGTLVSDSGAANHWGAQRFYL